ncbi:MAG: SAM-dependent methyltransferase [Actinomycetota bacterium]|nr:SAM-dependent methyltransferase [Actinomycetota bacterium]
MNDPTYNLTPIGRVLIDEDGYALEIDEPYRPALTSLEGFSHINVLWWCHQFDEPSFRGMTVADKPYKQGPDVVGIFATRSPARPNPIALTAVPVISVNIESGIVRAAYVDAADGTPILDLKPYLPAVDRIRQTRCPDWCADWPEWYEDSATFDWGAVFENAQ